MDSRREILPREGGLCGDPTRDEFEGRPVDDSDWEIHRGRRNCPRV